MSKGGLDLTALEFKDEIGTHTRWVRVFDRVKSGEMPPPKHGKVAAQEQQKFLALLGEDLNKQHASLKGTVLRRLNRIEYQNTLNDAFGIRGNLTELLPEDTLAHGFDNQGDALGISDVHMLRYMDAAKTALALACTPEARPETKKERYTYNDPIFERALSPNLTSGGGKWLQRPDGAVVFFTRGYPNTALRPFNAWGDGPYKMSISGYGYQTDKPVTFALQLGNSSGLFFSTKGIYTEGYYSVPPNTPTIVETTHWLARGDSLRISAEGLVGKPGAPGLHNLKGGVAAYQGSGLAILHVDVEGPLLDEWPQRGYTMLFGDLPTKDKEKSSAAAPKVKSKRVASGPTLEVVSANPSADAKRLLPGFITRLFRRPVSAQQVAPYLALFEAEMKQGTSFEDSMRVAATAALCSPGFLYLRESPGKLDDYALASRLSYFLGRTLPDVELLRLAAEGKLKQPEVLNAQADRLLAHANAQRFVADFTDGWLDLRNIDFTTPDKQLYPEFDEMLDDSLLPETRAFFAELIKENLPLSNIIQSDFAMLNARLAKHYGIAGVTNLEVKKTKLPPDSKRGGILTQASVLKVSANGTSTSPVIRGIWVIDRILGFKPPPPPPGVPGVEPDIRGATTVRDILAKHRTLESCNACHRAIDPPGFALECFDVIGGFRERFRSLGDGDPVKLEFESKKVRYKLAKPVDASGELLSGEKFGGFSDFQKILLKKQDQVAKALTENLLTFATGREMGFSDREEVARIVQALGKKGNGVKDLIHLVVSSEIFLNK